MRKITSLLAVWWMGTLAQAQPVHPIKLLSEDVSLRQTPRVYPAEGIKAKDQDIQAIFIEGKAYQGKPTRAFAWMGVPKVEAGKKVPGMVLIHGGGGTAFEAWVKLWVSRGYAAIAVDTCGQIPVGTYGKWKRHEWSGPAGWDNTFKQIGEPLTDQWPYHAISDVMLAHSLLRSQAGVDGDRIGVTGISWGGYLTCLVVGVDSRFKFAVPVYGCGHIDLCTWRPILEKMTPEVRQKWIDTWDPRHFLAEASMPMLWVTGTNDFAYPFDALQKSYRAPRTARTLCIRLRMPHGHGGAGENPAEILVYADSFLREGAGLLKIGSQKRDGNAAAVTVTGKAKAAKAELLVTKDVGAWQKRKWEVVEAKVEGEKVTALIPEGARVYYVNVIDGAGNVVSTEHEELGEK